MGIKKENREGSASDSRWNGASSRLLSLYVVVAVVAVGICTAVVALVAVGHIEFVQGREGQ